MKNKLFIVLATVAILAFVLAFSVSAESVHEGKVDLSATVILDDGTECALFDSEGNALLWYTTGKDTDGKKIYESIRSDDPRVKYKIESWGEVTQTYILMDDGTKYSTSSYVVFNMLDDDVLANTGDAGNIGKPVTFCKLWLSFCNNLEYVYLRLDTTRIQKQSFKGCPNLKYINLEDLTQLTRIGDGENFSGCTSLFKGQILDLSKTSLTSIDNGGSFNGVPLKGVKLPSTLTTISSWTFQGTAIESIVWPTSVNKIEGSMFKNNTAITTICFSNTLTSIGNDTFLNVNTLEKIFFVGTRDEFVALLESVSTTNNGAFFAVVGEDNANLISYTDYMALSDKSGKYVVYDYSYCEAYSEGNHQVSGDIEMLPVESYFEEILFGGACSVCGSYVIDDSYTIDALFVSLGISAKEFGGNIGLVQGYEVNRAAITAYKNYVADFEFGILAYANRDGEAIQPRPGEDNVVDIVFDNMVNDYIDVKVTSIPASYQDTAIVFCIYVTEGERFSYLDNGETVEKIVGHKYTTFVPQA